MNHTGPTPTERTQMIQYESQVMQLNALMRECGGHVSRKHRHAVGTASLDLMLVKANPGDTIVRTFERSVSPWEYKANQDGYAFWFANAGRWGYLALPPNHYPINTQTGP